MFVSFFAKPKAASFPSTSAKGSVPVQRQESRPNSPTKIPDFKKTFRPFSLKKDAELAPVNWFRAQRTKAKAGKRRSVRHHLEGDVIVIEDDEDKKVDEDVEMIDLSQQDGDPDFGQLTAECKRMIKGGAEWLHMGMSTADISLRIAVLIHGHRCHGWVNRLLPYSTTQH